MQKFLLKLVAAAFMSGLVLFILCANALYIAVDRWAMLHEASAIGVELELAVVFFDSDIDMTYKRAETAFDLVRARSVRHVLLVGGARPERGFYGSVALRDRLSMEPGFENATWVADRHSFDTHSNLEAMRRHLATDAPSGTIALVSDDYHLFRIAYYLREDYDIAKRIIFVPSVQDRSIHQHLERIVWELAAWTLEFAPDYLRRVAIDMSRS